MKIICKIIMLFLLAVVILETRVKGEDKKQRHLYLCIGQSNMAGRSPYTKEEKKIIKKCYLINDKNEWVPAKNPLNLYSTIRKAISSQKMGPAYTFSKAMLQKNKGVSIGLIVNARGGSSIKYWVRGSKFYKEALRRTKIAQKTSVLKGIIWHQGESDAGDKKYLEKLKKLVENIREDLGAPNLPFVAGQVNNLKLINDQIAELPKNEAFTAYVSSKGLKAMDRWHFDAKSMRLLGKRYATAMLKLQNSQKPKGKRHLFILSGQSNMERFNERVSFKPAIEKKFGKQNVVFVKDAQGGRRILHWYKKWKLPKGARGKPKTTGDLYERLMKKVRPVIVKEKFKTVTFIWMQGESDAQYKKYGAIYAESLKGLFVQIKKDLKRDDINFVIGRISDFNEK